MAYLFAVSAANTALFSSSLAASATAKAANAAALVAAAASFAVLATKAALSTFLSAQASAFLIHQKNLESLYQLLSRIEQTTAHSVGSSSKIPPIIPFGLLLWRFFFFLAVLCAKILPTNFSTRISSSVVNGDAEDNDDDDHNRSSKTEGAGFFGRVLFCKIPSFVRISCVVADLDWLVGSLLLLVLAPASTVSASFSSSLLWIGGGFAAAADSTTSNDGAVHHPTDVATKTAAVVAAESFKL